LNKNTSNPLNNFWAGSGQAGPAAGSAAGLGAGPNKTVPTDELLQTTEDLLSEEEQSL